MLLSTQCRHCKKKFTATHGNREYCLETSCQKVKKALTQKKYYDVYKDIVGGYVGNYKLFEESLLKGETLTVALSDFQIKGFDPNAFYGAVKDASKKEWYLVKDYAFHIFYKTNDNKTYLTIKKL